MRARTRARREHGTDHAPDPAVTDPEPLDGELVAALAELPPNQRAAITLFYFAGLSTDEVAETLDVGPSTARSHLQRGRAAVARRLAMPEEVTDGH